MPWLTCLPNLLANATPNTWNRNTPPPPPTKTNYKGWIIGRAGQNGILEDVWGAQGSLADPGWQVQRHLEMQRQLMHSVRAELRDSTIV